MTARTTTKLFAVSAIALLGLSACGSKDSSSTSTSTTSSTSSSGASAGSSGSPAASTSGSPADSSSPVASTSTGSTASKNYTDAQLSQMLTGVTVGGRTLQVAPETQVAQVKKALTSSQVAQAMQQATVTPASCKTATVNGTKLVQQNVPIAIGGNTSGPMVVLRSMPSVDAAKQILAANKSMATDCPSYTMVMNQAGQKMTIKGSTKSMDITAASTEGTAGQESSYSTTGKQSTTTTALGNVGNVLIQVTDSSGKETAAQLSKDLEAVAKSVVAKK